MIVMKFGGTSVEDARSFANAISLVVQQKERQPVVVLSAIARATDALLKSAQISVAEEYGQAESILNDLLERHVVIAENLIESRSAIQRLIFDLRRRFEELRNLCQSIAVLGELTKRSLDTIAAMGELMSSMIFHEAMGERHINSTWVDARTFMMTDDSFGNANPNFNDIDSKAPAAILRHLDERRIVVTQGYIGATPKKVTTTLGRGGSDYSAAIIGAALNAQEIQIWTDVDGILTADPRIAPGAKKLKAISYKEASELAYFGAKVLHPSTLRPAVLKNIPVVVLNSKHPGSTGTRILASLPPSNVSVKSIASKRGISVINAQATRFLTANRFLESILDVFGRHNSPLDLINTSAASASLTITNPEKLDLVAAELGEFADVTIFRNKAIVSIVGERLHSTVGIADRIFRALGEIDVMMISQGASELNVSLVIDEENVNKAVQRLHKEFFEPLPSEQIFEDLTTD
ncbi:MAG TPA: lysine-sensitive aspartokinase 3 [Bacteroidota bacterium]|nr:lysine-sensitive aspartokinase 3 [Bacteroidota bacterium]